MTSNQSMISIFPKKANQQINNRMRSLDQTQRLHSYTHTHISPQQHSAVLHVHTAAAIERSTGPAAIARSVGKMGCDAASECMRCACNRDLVSQADHVSLARTPRRHHEKAKNKRVCQMLWYFAMLTFVFANSTLPNRQKKHIA
jgi:hypothetical protein